MRWTGLVRQEAMGVVGTVDGSGPDCNGMLRMGRKGRLGTLWLVMEGQEWPGKDRCGK